MQLINITVKHLLMFLRMYWNTHYANDSVRYFMSTS